MQSTQIGCISRSLRTLGEELEVAPPVALQAAFSAGPVLRFGPAGEFVVRIAASEEDRRRAWALAYQVYLEKEYAEPRAGRLWYSRFDALPGTITVLVERTAVEGGGWKAEGRECPAASTFHPPPSTSLIGAVTIVPDSSMGLPSDETFPVEMSVLRSGGRRLAEAVSLVQAGTSERSGVLVAARLCELTCLVAERVLGATDLVITVNPRHEDYYRRVMLFERRGGVARCQKVSGAPAVFLTLSFADMAGHRRRASGPDAPRTLYRRFASDEDWDALAARIRAEARPLDASALRRYFPE